MGISHIVLFRLLTNGWREIAWDACSEEVKNLGVNVWPAACVSIAVYRISQNSLVSFLTIQSFLRPVKIITS
jgi:hypothetical protein